MEEARCLSQANGVFLSKRSNTGGGTSYAGSSVGPVSAVVEEAAGVSAASALAAGMPLPYVSSQPRAEQAGSPTAEEPAWEEAGWSFDDIPGSGPAAFPTSVSLQSWSAPSSEHSTASVALAQVALPAAASQGPEGNGSWDDKFAAGMTAAAAQMDLPELPTGVASGLSVPARGWSPKPTHAPVAPAPAHIPLMASAATQPAPASPAGLWENPKKGVANGVDGEELISLLAMLGVQG